MARKVSIDQIVNGDVSVVAMNDAIAIMAVALCVGVLVGCVIGWNLCVVWQRLHPAVCKICQ